MPYAIIKWPNEMLICRASTSPSYGSTPRKYKQKWRQEWLMDFDPLKSSMICMLCHKRLESLKVDTIKKHHQRFHQDLNITTCSTSKKKLLIIKYETEKQKQQGQLQKFLDPQRKVALASFKLAYVIGQNKKPLSDCEHYRVCKIS